MNGPTEPTTSTSEPAPGMIRQNSILAVTRALVQKARNEEIEQQKRAKWKADNANKKIVSAADRADKQISLEHYKQLMTVFGDDQGDLDPFDDGYRDGFKSLSLPEFIDVFKKVVGETSVTDEQIENLFIQMDTNMDDRITFQEFSNYVLYRAQAKDTSEDDESEVEVFSPPLKPIPTPHLQGIRKIVFVPKIARSFTCSHDGHLCYWNEKFIYQKSFKNTFREADAPGKQFLPIGRKAARWTLDFCYFTDINKLALSSDDREVTFFDVQTMEPEVKFLFQDLTPIAIDCQSDSTTNYLFMGTDTGHLAFFRFDEYHLFTRDRASGGRLRSVCPELYSKNNNSNVSFQKIKLHNEWVEKIQYVPELQCVISCSLDSRKSLAVGFTKDHAWEFSTASVSNGVSTFTYCNKPMTIITGGLDHIIRIWNPRIMSRPIGILTGHHSPIVSITARETIGQIISLSTDDNIKIWDMRGQYCLQTIEPFYHGLKSTLTCVSYFQSRLVACSSHIILRDLKLDSEHAVAKDPVSHSSPIRRCFYSPLLKQAMSVCERGTVKVWDIVSGQRTFQIPTAHEDNEVSAACLDTNERRLITGGRDGIRIWNHNNGQVLFELVKKDSSEVTALLHIDLRESQYVIAASRNRKVTSYMDCDENGFLGTATAVIHPHFVFPKESSEWHDEDVLCLAFCPPNILASGGADGKVIVTNFVSGAVMHAMRIPKCHTMAPAEKMIFTLQFVPNRAHLREAASLISGGADGVVRFWNTHSGQQQWEQEVCARSNCDCGIYAMVLVDAQTLVTGDASGTVKFWNIADVAMTSATAYPMVLTSAYRAHAAQITSLVTIREQQLILSGSLDMSVRLYTFKGEYVGTFGQPDIWDWIEPNSYKHPIKPTDVIAAELEDARNNVKPTQPVKQETSSTKVNDSIASVNSEVDNPAVTIVDRRRSEMDLARKVADKLKNKRSGSISGTSGAFLFMNQPVVAARLKTADVLKKDYYRSKFANTIYAQSTFHNGHSVRDPKSVKINARPDELYRHLDMPSFQMTIPTDLIKKPDMSLTRFKTTLPPLSASSGSSRFFRQS